MLIYLLLTGTTSELFLPFLREEALREGAELEISNLKVGVVEAVFSRGVSSVGDGDLISSGFYVILLKFRDFCPRSITVKILFLGYCVIK